MKLVVIADARYPIAEPFAGGMQSLTWHLANGMRQRGIDVTVFAGPGSDPHLGVRELGVRPLVLSPQARGDVSMAPQEWLELHHAYLQLMMALGSETDGVVHNNSLHHLPVAMAEALSLPMVTTLHTPPTPWLEPAIDLCDKSRHQFVAVSRHTAQAWGQVVTADVLLNGVDTDRWPYRDGGADVVWFGRFVPEKAPHLAIDIAQKAGIPIRLAGPVSDPEYFRTQIAPRIRGGVTYVGHLNQGALAALVGNSGACLVTPTWDEPYGLTAAEALSCGTPVLAFDRGGLAEVVSPECSRLAASSDTEAAAGLLREVVALDRRAARHHAERHCSLTVMLDSYERVYDAALETQNR